MAIATKSLDDLYSGSTTGSMERAILENLRGIDHQQTPGALPTTREMPGFTFFTRPQLNMQADNLRNLRQLSGILLSDRATSVQKYIRCLLDPRLAVGVNYGEGNVIPPSPCPIIDNASAFIPTFTNQLLSVSGWPSISAPTHTTTPGLYNETQTSYDGRVIEHGSYTINCNFRNTRGDINLLALYSWVVYGSAVNEGLLVPYLDMITENEYDYNTRIYRIVLDHNKRRITKLSCCHAAIPKGIPTGDAFDVPAEKTYVDANQTLSIQFACDGFNIFDTIVAREFNETVEIFNPSMLEENRSQFMVEIPQRLLRVFNREKCYPRINLETSDLEWWTYKTIFNARVDRFLSSLPQTSSEDYTGD